MSFDSDTINTSEAVVGRQDTVFALGILVQMIASSGLLWLFAREMPAERSITGLPA